MRSKTKGSIQRSQITERAKGDGLNWILIAGGALLSTLTIRVGCKLKQVLETKGSNKDIRGNKNTEKQRLGECQLHSNLCKFAHDRDSYYHYVSGDATGGVPTKHVSDIQISEESNLSLPLAKLSAAAELNRGSNASTMWASSSELLELPHKQFHDSAGSGSPSISESGSDIYTKREVINKLRRQLKSRDEMIMEMQKQIASLQKSLCTQTSQVAQMQIQLETANQELFESEREIQRLRKAVANRCISKSDFVEKLTYVANWRTETAGSIDDPDPHCFGLRKAEGDEERVVMLKKELGELREAIELKDFLLQSYKQQKPELVSPAKEQRLEPHQQNTF